MCVRACVRVVVRACLRERVHACVCAYVVLTDNHIDLLPDGKIVLTQGIFLISLTWLDCKLMSCAS